MTTNQTEESWIWLPATGSSQIRRARPPTSVVPMLSVGRDSFSPSLCITEDPFHLHRLLQSRRDFTTELTYPPFSSRLPLVSSLKSFPYLYSLRAIMMTFPLDSPLASPLSFIIFFFALLLLCVAGPAFFSGEVLGCLT